MTHANEEASSLDDLDKLGHRMSSGDDSNLPPMPERSAPSFLRFLPPLVREMWDKGANLQLDNASGMLLIDGFYKNGAMKLDFRENGIVAIDKRGRESDVRSFDDLVDLNYAFWRQANSQKGVYVQPQRPWLDAMLEKKKLKRQVIFVAADDSDTGDLAD